MHPAFKHFAEIIFVFVLGEINFEEARTVIDAMPLKPPKNNKGIFWREVLVLDVIRECVRKNLIIF